MIQLYSSCTSFCYSNNLSIPINVSVWFLYPIHICLQFHDQLLAAQPARLVNPHQRSCLNHVSFSHSPPVPRPAPSHSIRTICQSSSMFLFDSRNQFTFASIPRPAPSHSQFVRLINYMVKWFASCLQAAQFKSLPSSTK